MNNLEDIFEFDESLVGFIHYEWVDKDDVIQTPSQVHVRVLQGKPELIRLEVWHGQSKTGQRLFLSEEEALELAFHLIKASNSACFSEGLKIGSDEFVEAR